MYEAITVVKVRKPTTVKIPAGGWLLLCTPDQPLHLHVAKRADLVKKGPVNEDFERLMIGRLQDTSAPINFVTADQKDAAEQTHAANQKNLEQSHKDALKRQKQHAATEREEEQRKHDDQLAEINRQNDSVRLQGATNKSATEVQLEIEPETPNSKPETAVNEFTREALNAKEHGELITVAQELFQVGRLAEMPTGKKSKLITAILSATPLPTET